ncbi:sulfate ABC transporter substrate-binding protein [Leptospira ryugenii]|nr:sulfate ABC transporter substrate-binding protein [Leptospira ryugenii]
MKSKKFSNFRRFLALFVFFCTIAIFAETELLNVSFDPTRELYEEINLKFTQSQKGKTELTIQQSHGGSGKQARAVIDGLKADVVTLALSYDIDSIAKISNLIEKNWQTQFPNRSVPYYSTIVFLVRKSNPKKIKGWEDLSKDGIGVITPNPKTSGGARWNYLAAYGFAKRKWKSEEKATAFIQKIFENTLVLDTGARGSTTTFVKRGLGDVLITWENEAKLALEESAKNGDGSFQIIYPEESILAETPVAIVKGNTDKKGTTELAKAYLSYLYTPEAQNIIAKHNFRPTDKKVMKQFEADFPKINTFSITDIEGSWEEAHKKHFADGGVFDQIYTKK